MRLIAFLQAWDLLRDELGRSPTMAEYARRFGLARSTADRDRAVFDDAFPDLGPDADLDLLWGWREARAASSSQPPSPSEEGEGADQHADHHDDDHPEGVNGVL